MRVEVQAALPEQVEADVVAVPLTAGDGWPARQRSWKASSAGCSRRLARDGELEQRARQRVARARRRRARRAASLVAASASATSSTPTRCARRPPRWPATPVSSSTRSPGRSTTRCRCRSRSRRGAIVEGTILGAYDPARWKQRGAASAKLGEADPLRRRRRAGRGGGARRDGRRLGEPGPRPRQQPAERDRIPSGSPSARARSRPRSSNVEAEALGPDEIASSGHGRPRRGRAGQRQRAAPGRAPLRAAEPATRRPRAGPRRQGDHVRHRRHLAQARRCTWRT